MSQTFNGLIYEDGELRSASIGKDEGYVNLWVSGNIRDDIEDVDDLAHTLFFTDNEHFAAWVASSGDVAALTPEDVWPV